jgi:hypothetical protein
MNGDHIYCLMVTGAALSDAIRNVLFDKAQELVRNGPPKVRLVHDDFEGQITTDGDTELMGSISGQVFNAVVETDRMKTTVRYLVRPGDLHIDQRVWL